MKFNYFNITLFSVSLNILLLSSQVYNERNHILTLHNTTTVSRVLCECELYAQANYDNDPEMKAVMQDFDQQMSQRFREYDERMIKNRQKCKDQCDKDIQKIILKDKIEKELKEKLATLETNINTKDLPICECEKSLTDKVEKGCLGCGVLGSGIAPNVGLFGEVVLGAWKASALVTAKELAEKAGAAAGEVARIKAGIEAVISGLTSEFGIDKLGLATLESFFNETNYMKESLISHSVYMQYEESKCVFFGAGPEKPICTLVPQKFLVHTNVYSTQEVIGATVKEIVANSESISGMAAEKAIKETTTALTAQNTGAVNATYASSQIVIVASIVAILVIVLVMVIIYLILRYRRKKKMKKKLQYIKLLKK
ncbi:PIR protein, putative [Plasmodium sp.]|nr:PIR protein, putative [Plasmodium sp.]